MIHLATPDGGPLCNAGPEDIGVGLLTLRLARDLADVDCPACIALSEAPAELASHSAGPKLVHLAAPECLMLIEPGMTASINPDAPMRALCGAGHRDEMGTTRLRITVNDEGVTCADCWQRLGAEEAEAFDERLVDAVDKMGEAISEAAMAAGDEAAVVIDHFDLTGVSLLADGSVAPTFTYDTPDNGQAGDGQEQ